MKQEHITDLFGTTIRLQMRESIQMTIQSLLAYCHKYDHWCMAYSGGKDSTTLVTLVVWLIDTGQIPRPKSMTVMYADTRLELTPLWAAAQDIIEDLKGYGFDVRIVVAPLEKRYFTYILGRGVPPPTNTFRWCTPKMKVDPMTKELELLFSEKGEKVLMLTGVRQGESAIRDQRIVMSCGKDGAECGQGWYQETMPDHICDTLAPLLHWRVCHIWSWLKYWAPTPEYGDWSTSAIADSYGGDEAEELNARTGCIGCNLVSVDKALNNVLKNPRYYYLKPLLRVKLLNNLLRLPANRLRKTGLAPSDNFRQRIGPLTMLARKMGLDEILSIQNEINASAKNEGMPLISLINEEEESYIRKCWEENLWPDRWDGTESTGDTEMETVFKDGSIQRRLIFGD